ncbi:unnamed protein product [Eretmochelys imbricata]
MNSFKRLNLRPGVVEDNAEGKAIMSESLCSEIKELILLKTGLSGITSEHLEVVAAAAAAVLLKSPPPPFQEWQMNLWEYNPEFWNFADLRQPTSCGWGAAEGKGNASKYSCLWKLQSNNLKVQPWHSFETDKWKLWFVFF